MPAFGDLLDLSTTHLPEHLADNLSAAPGVAAHATAAGWLMSVPACPDRPGRAAGQAAPEVIVAIWRHARALGCDYVLFAADADQIDCLPTWRA